MINTKGDKLNILSCRGPTCLMMAVAQLQCLQYRHPLTHTDQLQASLLLSRLTRPMQDLNSMNKSYQTASFKTGSQITYRTV